VDLDNDVDFDDVIGLSPNFGSNVANGFGGGDFDGDGDVDFDDIIILSPNFGSSGGANTPLNIAAMAGSGAGAAAGVPEPASIALAGLGLLAVAGLARRR
jgi:hypothetical protein